MLRAIQCRSPRAKLASESLEPEQSQIRDTHPLMPGKSIKKPPRRSVTAGMKSEAEKILSGVERGLLELLDSDDDGDNARCA